MSPTVDLDAGANSRGLARNVTSRRSLHLQRAIQLPEIRSLAPHTLRRSRRPIKENLPRNGCWNGWVRAITLFSLFLHQSISFLTLSHSLAFSLASFLSRLQSCLLARSLTRLLRTVLRHCRYGANLHPFANGCHKRRSNRLRRRQASSPNLDGVPGLKSKIGRRKKVRDAGSGTLSTTSE